MDGGKALAGGCPVSFPFGSRFGFRGKRGVAFLLVLFFGFSLVAGGSSSVGGAYLDAVLSESSSFRLSTPLDVGLGVGSLALVGGNLIWEKNSSFPEYSEVPSVAFEDLNFLDRIAVFGYNDALDKASTIATVGILATPLVYAIAKGNVFKGDVPKGSAFHGDSSSSDGVFNGDMSSNGDAMWGYGLMYLETIAMTYGLKELAKNIVVRERPYVYGSDVPASEFDNGDYCRSFPSGHTALAFASATFLTMVMGFDDSDSTWRIPVCVGSYAAALGVAAMRVLSGNHYITDVLAGALVGAACGIVVPLLHLGNSSSGSVSNGSSLRIGVAPTGVAFGFSY